MLLTCPECELPVSDRAIICPHCGYPLKETAKNIRPSSKRKRLPNGFGQISKIKGQNLRKPYRAMITVGKNPVTGKHIQKLLKPEAYFETYNDAYAALIEYNKNPYDLDDDITMLELYEKWSSDRLKSVSDAYMRTVKSSWAYCSSIYNLRVKDIRPRHIKECIETGTRTIEVGAKKGETVSPSPGTKARMKSLFNLLLDYAVEEEYIQVNPARNFEISDGITKEIESNRRGHVPFTEEEMEMLWGRKDQKYVDWILIQCYMGWRPQELATLKLSEVNIKDWYMCAGMKTEAGKQRLVPIHSKIRDLVMKNYEFAKSIGSEYLLNDKGQTHSSSWGITYDKYAHRFKKVMDALSFSKEHRPHDPRTTFITRGKKCGMDEYALKEMVGHSVQDITESVYTVRDIEWLRSDLEKLK